jgi:aldose 1-epimerase
MSFASGKARVVLAFALLAGSIALPATALAAGAVTASIALFGTATDGQTVQIITLKNARGMTVRFSTRGGTITEILTPDRKGKTNNVVLGRPDFAAWEKSGGFNSVIGRYANRIAGGGFTLDGTFYKIVGANPNNGVVLHGGPNGFSNRLWRAATFESAGSAGAKLTYVSADGENGFPGELSVTMTYTLTPDNVLRLEYDATTTKPTVLTLTNHAYFNLGGYDSGPVYDQILQVNAAKWTPTDPNQVPTGEIRDVAGTVFDFRKPRRVADAVYSTDPQIMLARGIDHNWVIDKGTGPGIPVAVRLSDPKSGRRLEVRTTEPGVQIYTANGFAGQMTGANGRTLRQGDGIAFETEHYPDSPNKPNFPSTVLRPGETFHSVTEYAFSVGQ